MQKLNLIDTLFNLFPGADYVIHAIVGGIVLFWKHIMIKGSLGIYFGYLYSFKIALLKEVYDYVNSNVVTFESVLDVISTMIGALIVHLIILHIQKYPKSQ